ncbi:MAG: family 10 glycosylhydrolase [Leptolyngbyaceae cyanobacterium SM1_3_5]|nr:family 10 glycosylhydrolase [Leptolyngbyaceae cyanobacterium SM1_3_5]
MSVSPNRTAIARLGCLLIIPLLAPAIALPAAATPPVIQGVRQAPVVLGVVRSADNAAQWPNIAARLQGSEYRVIEWDQVRSPQDLAAVTVLFLPSVETIDSAQLLALEAWMGQGGRVIVTGAIGTRSSYGVQQALRSILGAYWQQSIEQPTRLTLPRRRTEIWVQQGNTRSAIVGGVLGQSGVASESIATWGSVGGSTDQAAIVVTGRSVFLGWEWGEMASEFDRTWFQAAIGRYGTLRAGRAIEPTPTAATAATGAIAPPVQPTADPAEQVVPAQIQVQPSGQPISAAEAIAMQQELASLIGRFESALLSEASAGSSIDLAALPEDKSPDAEITPIGNSALTQARQILGDFPQLVRDRNYSAARQQWILARRTLWDNFPTDRPIAQPEIRAIWLDRGTIVEAGSPEGLAEVFDRLAAAGINTVSLKRSTPDIRFIPAGLRRSKIPWCAAGTRWRQRIELAHDRDMELHAWVWTFAAGNQLHNRLVNQPASYLGPVLAAHPDWANYDNAGNSIPAGQTKPFLDPANPEVRQYLLSLFDEIVTRYNVDGLQLDYIRYPFQDPSANRTYGYGIAARQQFQQLTGTDPIALTPSSPLWPRWTQFRVEQVNSFVAETAQLLRSRRYRSGSASRSNLLLSTAVFPLATGDRLNRIQQHWELWAQRGDVDLIVPMSYAMDTNGLLRLATPWLTRADVGSALVLPSIRLLNLPDATAIDQIQALRDSSAGGYSLFAAENLSAGLETVFDRTQGQAALIPYRQPFQAAALRYAALTREWSYWLGQNQLASLDQQQVWRSQATALGEALDRLAADPSEANFDLAQSRLRRFQAAFPGWMQTEDEYRVRTWQNRLGAIADLLAFGDRRRPANAPAGVEETQR